MVSNKRQTVETNLTCKECGNIQMIRRKLGRQRAPGHVKHIYCYKCQAVTAHVEELEKLNQLRGDDYGEVK